MNNVFQITLNAEQMRILNSALIEMPYKMAAPLIAEINKQIQAAFDSVVDDKQTDQSK